MKNHCDRHDDAQDTQVAIGRVGYGTGNCQYKQSAKRNNPSECSSQCKTKDPAQREYTKADHGHFCTVVTGGVWLIFFRQDWTKRGIQPATSERVDQIKRRKKRPRDEGCPE